MGYKVANQVDAAQFGRNPKQVLDLLRQPIPVDSMFGSGPTPWGVHFALRPMHLPKSRENRLREYHVELEKLMAACGAQPSPAAAVALMKSHE